METTKPGNGAEIYYMLHEDIADSIWEWYGKEELERVLGRNPIDSDDE